MYFPIRYIQDIADSAGIDSPVAPFAKSTPKDRYAILYYEYDISGKKKSLLLEDYVIYHGQRLDRREFAYDDGNTSLAQYLYGKEGNLWKVVWKYSRPMPKRFNEYKVGKKYQKVEDVYIDGFLRERRYHDERCTDFFYYGEDKYSPMKNIYYKSVREKENEIIQYIERYNSKNRIVSQWQCSAEISNPAKIIEDQTSLYYYDDGGNISRIECLSVDSLIDVIKRKYVYSDFDARGNWLKEMRYMKFYDEDAEELKQVCTREIAYDEAAAIELRTKFESLKTEMIVNNEFNNIPCL